MKNNKNIIIIIGIVLCLGLASIFIFKNNNSDNNSEIGDTNFCWNDNSDEILDFMKEELDEKLYRSGNLKTVSSGISDVNKTEFGETKILEYNNIDFTEMDYFNSFDGNYIIKIAQDKDGKNMILSKRYEINIDYANYATDSSYFKSEVEEIVNDFSSKYAKQYDNSSSYIEYIFESSNSCAQIVTGEGDLKFTLTINYYNPMFNSKDIENKEVYNYINSGEFYDYL